MSANQAGFLLLICLIIKWNIFIRKHREAGSTVIKFEINVQTLLASDF